MGKKHSNKSNILDENNLKFYYGIPHAHCAFSTGRGTPLEAFDYARHNGINFLILTDHNNYLSKTVRIKGKEMNKWDASVYLSSKYNRKHENFLSIIGFESKTDPFGDMNIVNSSLFFTGTVKNFQLLTIWMLNNPDAFICINHPHKQIHYLEYNKILNKLITSIEVGNGSSPKKYVNHEKYYYFLLDKGWKLGAINGQDNHRLNFGDDENLTCMISKNSLTTSSLVYAFRHRLTYSTESRTLKFYFTINNIFMGNIISRKHTELNFNIFVEDPNYKISEIHILSNKATVIKKASELNLNRIRYLYRHKPKANETWYVIKIILQNKKIAISSPIFRG